MPEPIHAWWARRQWSKGRPIPYVVGEFRADWAPYPVLVRQFHPDLNGGIVLTQIPPGADVWVCWECDLGHRFIATPTEQRSRPGRERRRSSWCPDCTAMAQPRPWMQRPDDWPATIPTPVRLMPPNGPDALPSGVRPARTTAAPTRNPRARSRPRSRTLCPVTPAVPAGTAFPSTCAPPTASAAEAALRADIAAVLELPLHDIAIRLRTAFFDHCEAWPDLVIPELRIAVEYDATGRHGLEHVGAREQADRRKDRAVRAVGWEVVRIRTGRLQPLGPYDLELSAGSARTAAALVEQFRVIRGPLLVDAYLR